MVKGRTWFAYIALQRYVVDSAAGRQRTPAMASAHLAARPAGAKLKCVAGDKLGKEE